MNLKAFTATTLVSLLSVAATPASAQVLLQSPTVQVTLQDLQAETQRLPADARSAMLSRPETLKQIATNLLIRRQLAQDALKAGFEQDPKVAATLQIMRDKTLAELYLERQSAQAKPNDAALDQYARGLYNTLPKAQLEEAETVQVRHILVAKDEPDAAAKAAKLLEQLKSGSPFEALAKEHSKDLGSAAKGGDIGFVNRGQTVKPFEDAAFALKAKGDLSGVVESSFGFHIIQLIQRKPARIKTFEDMREGLRGQATGKLQAEQQNKIYEEIRAKGKFNDAEIDALAEQYGKSK